MSASNMEIEEGNNMMPLVSIIVPIYNMANSIEHSILSYIAQDYPNIEIILIDDGSQDNSLKKCLEIADKHPIVRVIHTENQGSGPARNAGIAASKGCYAYFPDADDFLESHAISTLVRAITEIEDCDLVVFGYINKNLKGQIIRKQCYSESVRLAKELRDSYAQCMTTTTVWSIQGAPWNKFFDLRIIKTNNIEYPPLRRHQDECFIASYMCVAHKVHYISDVLYTYYVNDLKKEWQKYPVNYIDSVLGLYENRQKTIMTWNEKDTLTHEMVQKEYICFVIKSLELSFSPKFGLSFQERKKWICNILLKTKILDIQIPSVLGWYQKLFIFLAKYNMMLSYLLLKTKVKYEQEYK